MMAGAAAIGLSLLHPLTGAAAELKKQYWATSSDPQRR